MKNIYDTLEFNQIKNKVISFCVGDLAKDKITKLQPFDDLDDLKLNQKYLDQAMQLIYKYGRLPIGYYNDIELEGNVIRLTGNANFINLGSNTAEQPNISFVDNIFYAADGAVSNYRLFAGNSATINDLTLQNNTFVNVYTTGGMFNYGTLEQVVISNNLIYMQNQAANMYIFRPSSSTQQGVNYEGTYPGNPETGICDDNIVYDAAQGTFNKQWFYGGMNRVVLDPESEMTVITENPFSELDIPNERFVTSSTYSSYGAQQ